MIPHFQSYDWQQELRQGRIAKVYRDTEKKTHAVMVQLWQQQAMGRPPKSDQEKQNERKEQGEWKKWIQLREELSQNLHTFHTEYTDRIEYIRDFTTLRLKHTKEIHTCWWSGENMIPDNPC